MQVLGLIKRNFVTNDVVQWLCPSTPGILCPSLVAISEEDIECLKKVQTRATKLVKGLKNKSYPERLTLLHTTSLAKRSTRGDLMQVFRMLKASDSVEKELFFIG